MRDYASRLVIVAAIFILSVGVGLLVTQEGGRVPLLPDQVAAATGVYELTWSPDGKSIAYVSTQGGRSEIWLAPSSGGAGRRLTSSGGTKRQPRWSRDGKWIAYVAVQPSGAGDIHMVSADGYTTVPLTQTPADDRLPAWSPDARQIAFTETAGRRTRILVVDIETHSTRQLAEAPASDLQWSPDGHSILFVSDPLLGGDDRRENEDIFLVPAGGGSARLLTAGTPRYRDFAPSWSPDSRQVVFASQGPGFSNLVTVDLETGVKRNLIGGTADLLNPRWSPDGTNIAYIRNENSQFSLWLTPVQGGRPWQISDRDGVNAGFEIEHATPHGAFQWSPDGKRIAFTHSDPSHTSDVWVVSLDTARSTQLTNSMPSELRREARFVWPEITSYRSFDGTEVRALVYKPRGIKPGRGHPALLMFRDTLDGQNAVGWDPFVQFFVSDGYLVFAPNVRGSSGRGTDFRQLVFQYGGDHDVRDAFLGLDKLSSEGLIDADRVGLFGAGTGGFLVTASLIKDEARFKAAASLYGILDMVTAVSYPKIDRWSRYLIGSDPMSNPLPFYQRSLVNFVDKLRTPIIFLDPAANPSAPFQQLQQFGVQAEVKGKWYDYRVFEEESEAWQYWHPSSLRQALEAMDALFEKYLLGRDRDVRLSRR